jgi:hypothetical protein
MNADDDTTTTPTLSMPRARLEAERRGLVDPY